MKSKFIGYNPDLYKKEIARYISLNYEFTVKKTKSLTTIIINEQELIFTNVEKINSNVHFIIAMFRKDINKYYEANKHDFYWNDNFPKVKTGKNEYLTDELIGLDINLCYWNTAFNLGFITERTYKRGIFFRNKNLDDALLLEFINKTNYKKAKALNYDFDEAFLNGLVSEEKYKIATNNIKKGLVMSVGCLIQHIHYDIYAKDGSVKTILDNEFIEKYKPFHRSILGRVEMLMCELSNIEGFCFFETDCVYFSKNKDLFESVLKKYNYTYKETSIDVLSSTNEHIFFLDKKSNKKRAFKF
jgi:hypothetical protein